VIRRAGEIGIRESYSTVRTIAWDVTPFYTRTPTIASYSPTIVGALNVLPATALSLPRTRRTKSGHQFL
jgi:hypothetical protein